MKNVKASKTDISDGMPQNVFEHHQRIKNNSANPFIFRKSSGADSIRCNWHDNLELLFVTHGKAIMTYDAESIALKEGMTVIVNSRVMHGIPECGKLSFYILIIDSVFFRELGIDIEQCRFEKTTDSPETAELFMQTVRSLEKPQESEDFLYRARVRRDVTSLVIHLCEKHLAESSISLTSDCASKNHVKLAMQYINGKFPEPVSLEETAKNIGLNKSYLAREFRKYTGQTVHTYINSLRCTAADKYLAEGENVTNTALLSGFETLSYFSRTYKKIRGITPAEARENFKKQKM